MKLYLTYQTFVKTQQTMTFYPTAREVIVVCVVLSVCWKVYGVCWKACDSS